MKQLPEQGLYVISDCESNQHNELLEKTETILKNGVAIFQYRNKYIDENYLPLAKACRDLCKDYDCLFFVNDDLALAKELKADGIHLGKDDGDIKEAREFLGTNMLIGASCYNKLELAEYAYDAGSDYIAFGALFPSASKPNALKAEISLLKQAKEKIPVPIVAIGGITPQNADTIISAGADFIAVISGLYRSDNIADTTQQYLRQFTQQE